MLNDTLTDATTVLRMSIKGQKVGGGPVPRELSVPSKFWERSSHSAYEIT